MGRTLWSPEWWWQWGQGHRDALVGVRPQPWHTVLQVSEGRNPTATNHLPIVIYFKIRQEQSLLYLKHVLLCLTFPSLFSKPLPYSIFSPLTQLDFLILPFRAQFFSFPFHAIEVNSVYFRSCSLMYRGILLCITSIS